MTVYELNREQYKELCQAYITEFWTSDEGGPSWYDLAYADELVDQQIIFNHYDGIYFTDDDFLCTANKEEGK